MSPSAYWVAVIVPLVVQCLLFARWLHRRMRDDEIQRAFIRDLAANHLPYVAEALRQLASRAGVLLPEPPQLRYIEFANGEGNSSARVNRRGE